jgi:hypothetical protein
VFVGLPNDGGAIGGNKMEKQTLVRLLTKQFIFSFVNTILGISNVTHAYCYIGFSFSTMCVYVCANVIDEAQDIIDYSFFKWKI